MASASPVRRGVALLMISSMLAACSASDLVPPASIDSGTRVGAIQNSRTLPPQPVQTAYQAPPSPMASVGNGYAGGNQPASSWSPPPSQSMPQVAAPSAGGHYLRLPDQAPVQSASLAPPSSPARAPVGQSRIPESGVNMDSEFGFGPDESDVTGLAEEEEANIAEGTSDQPVVDGIGSDNPRALNGRRKPVSAPLADDRVIVPPKRAAAGMRTEPGAANWGDGSPVMAPTRAPLARREVAMLRPNNPAGALDDSGPMSEPDQPWLRQVMPQSELSCRAELKRMGVEFTDRPRISQGPSCGIDYPVKLSGLSGGINVSPAVTLNCQTTLAFAKWVKNELAPSARLRYLRGVQRITPLGGYSCRRMNNSRQRYNPISEHARGNAIDVGAIILKNGHDIDVRKKGFFSFREGALLKSVRNDSCKYFSTVLGPGSNAEHWNHFHFDLRSRKGGRRYCD